MQLHPHHHLSQFDKTDIKSIEDEWLIEVNQLQLFLSYTVANKHSKQAMFPGFAGDVRTLLPGKAKQPKKLNYSYHLLSFL